MNKIEEPLFTLKPLPPKAPRVERPEPDGAKQIALLDHLDDIAGQGQLFE